MKLSDEQIYDCAKSFTEICLQEHSIRSPSSKSTAEEAVNFFYHVIKKLEESNQ